jgi:carboxypeptidase T
MVCVCFLAALTAEHAGVSGQDENPILSSYWVPDVGEKILDEVADRFAILSRKNNGFEFVVPANRVAELIQLVPNAVLVNADLEGELRDSATPRGYHSFTDVETYVQNAVTTNPEIASFEIYGNSQEGRPLYALTLTGTEAVAHKPEIMLTSATHGNELITVEVILGMIDKLLAGYGKDQRITDLLNQHIVHFLPVINPDGFTRHSRFANGVDPNREYPYPTADNAHPNACIQAVMDYFNKHPIAGSIDFHSYAGTVMYPWSYTRSTPAEMESAFASLSNEMAGATGYRSGPIWKVMYIAKGGSADYYYWKGKTLALAVELMPGNVPPASQIPAIVNKNAKAVWHFIEHF